ncbi:protein arginine N-methyltransferase 5 isoform X1 [Plodia interpunctella]|uniref:protein arginine N-methyltransferase 5 isoform X1 n=1 Tax=Plodia interpunctella TaxID=58824 RepID=UPI0023689914|nr:protein arginine N-methyltransferase 5 isoform X1 [Plodia interpunctella]
MSQAEISCGLDFNITPDLQACLTEALHCNYSFIVAPIVHPRLRRQYIVGSSKTGGFTRSDMILSPQDWTVRLVGKLSPYLNVDSPSSIVRQKHEDCLNEELSYCRGLGVPAIMLKLHGRQTNNLSRILQTYYETSYHLSLTWVHVPMVCNRTLREFTSTSNEDEAAWNEPWHWWSSFHERMDWDKRVGVVLELSADLPSQEVIKRWLGEPVKAIIVPTSIFHNNKKGFPVLSRAHQQVVVSMVEREAQVIVSGARRSNVQFYLQYLYRVWKRQPNSSNDPMLSYAKGWEDYLQTPLQPLADNLDTHTYNVFEKDPVKYDQYQRAIAHALIGLKTADLQTQITNNLPKDLSLSEYQTNEIGQGDHSRPDKVYTVMVLGAGRGPLVRATLNAADVTKTKVKVIAVEKNPCAVVVLAAQTREVWRGRDVVVVPGDMRQLNLSPKADIIVSELLGSWGDNELSPECLDGANGLLKPGGISIPCRYNSYVAPISSPRLWAAAKVASTGAANSKDKNLETLWVVYMQNKHDIADTKLLFTFDHPAKSVQDSDGQEISDFRGLLLTDNRRSATLSWQVAQDNVMHGFGGYFDCLLYGNEMISIVPTTHSPGMISWFPVFIPIKTPLRVQKGQVITATFWRCVDSRRVWYEWVVEVGNRTTPLHNANGRSSQMLL